MSEMNTVGIIGGENAKECTNLLSALAQSCGLRAGPAQLKERHDFAGLIVLGTMSGETGEQVLKERPSIRILFSDVTQAATAIQFGSGPNAPLPFKGRTIITGSAIPDSLPALPGEAIATVQGKPLWITAIDGGIRHDIYWVSRPWISEGECVLHHLSFDRFMSLLPLLEWLRSISGWREWVQPPLRACFMFDDPNLHSTRYGFVSYHQLAAEGRRNRYHTSFATVPLDSYCVTGAASRAFLDNHQTLSLLIHGNNHSYRELAGAQAPGRQSALMRQAVKRISRLEQKSGVAVSRVMAPPHGVCSAATMEAMAGAGFEAACISNGSVWTGNPGVEWTMSLGTQPATIVAGLPVIPRFGLDQRMQNLALLAVYLNQPIIPVGHHWDLAKGTDILTSAAEFINGLGDVNWCNLTTIARNNYRFKIDGSLLRVQTFARITTVKIPEGISELQLEPSWLDQQQITVEYEDTGKAAEKSSPEVLSSPVRYRIRAGSNIKISAMPPQKGDEEPEVFPRTPLSSIARRLLSEIRDRSMPYLPESLVRR
jgi:hypothetical protein